MHSAPAPLCMLVCGTGLTHLFSQLCCLPKGAALQEWTHMRNAGRLGNGMSRAGRIDFDPECHQLSCIQDLYTLLSALPLQVSFWPFLGRLLPEVNK